MSLSIIISYHQEGQQFLEECITQVQDTVHISPLEIIVVDDCSLTPLKPIDNVTILRSQARSGVGASFDLGVSQAKYDNIFLMACDTRYKDNGWADLLYNEIQLYPKSLICTTCVGNENKFSGATILIFHDHISNPRKLATFRGLVEAQWLPYHSGESVEVPCILGACYGTTKQWYKYLDGFWGHRIWSNLEPYISMKSYLFGGSCRCVPLAETYHIFKSIKANVHKVPQSTTIYNKLLIATLLFDDAERLISFLGNDFAVLAAKAHFRSNYADVLDKKREYKDKTVFPMEAYIGKFKLDYRR